MRIFFTKHAESKFKILSELGWKINTSDIKKVLENSDQIQAGYLGRKVAIKEFDDKHDLRVVYSDEGGIMNVISFYPTTKGRYVKNKN